MTPLRKGKEGPTDRLAALPPCTMPASSVTPASTPSLCRADRAVKSIFLSTTRRVCRRNADEIRRSGRQVERCGRRLGTDDAQPSGRSAPLPKTAAAAALPRLSGDKQNNMLYMSIDCDFIII